MTTPTVQVGRVISLLVALMLSPVAARPAENEDVARSECELGITLALLGRPAAAESVFTSLLSHVPRDPRALTNLGNVALMRGEPDLALVFYQRAQTADSTDAGIVLNQATALLLLGQEDLATARAAEGVRRAGGAKAAADLLGLRYHEPKSETQKAEQHAYLSKEEVLTLLRVAAGKVPLDSVLVAPDTKEKKRAPIWRSAGPRAGTPAGAATLLYWKR